MSQKEDFIIFQTNKFTDKLSRIERNIDKIIAEMASTSETSNVYWSRINREVRAQYEEARKITKELVNDTIPKIYSQQVKEQLTRIKYKNLPVQKMVNYKDFISTNMVKQSIWSLLNETISTYNAGYLSGEKTLTRLASLTQQVLLSEKEVEKQISKGFIKEGKIYGSKKRLQKEFMKKSLDGKYITIFDKNGKQEQWKIKAYTELVARTKLHEASTQAVINTSAAVGADLIQVSSHNTQTAYDAQFEGKIFSLTGNDPDFPAVEDLPPFHPNCRHTISIVFKEALAQQGTLQKYIDFSNGEIEEHPTRRSFIPVSERKLA